MTDYAEFSKSLSASYDSDVKELADVLLKASISVFMVAILSLTIYSFRPYLTGVGDSLVVTLVTGTASLALVSVTLDEVIGRIRTEVVEERYTFKIQHDGLVSDLVKSSSHNAFGILLLLISTHVSSSPVESIQVLSLAFMKPIYEQLFSAGISVLSLVYLLIGCYLIVPPALYSKHVFDRTRDNRRNPS